MSAPNLGNPKTPNGALCSGIIGVLCAGMAVPENQSENQPNPKQPLQTGVLCPGIGGAYWCGIVVYFGAEYPFKNFILEYTTDQSDEIHSINLIKNQRGFEINIDKNSLNSNKRWYELAKPEIDKFINGL